MYSIEKKEGQEAYKAEHLTWHSPAFRWQSQNPLTAATEFAGRAGTPVVPTALQQQLKQLAAQEAEVIMLALRHARSSGSFFDRMRGRDRQLLLPLQAEAHRVIQFLVLQALTMTCEKCPGLQAPERLVQHVCGCSADTLRADLADYLAQPTAPGEVFARNVWELIHGPREKERFAVFALRMDSCLRRLLVEVVSVLETLMTTTDSAALGD